MAKATVPKARSRAASRRADPVPSLRPLVGARVYTVWLDMLRQLVPHGRTHRLSVLVASFLQYAAVRASEKWGTREPRAGSAAAVLQQAWEGGDPEEAEPTVCGLAERLLRDAGVRFQRVNHRGQQYSIAEDAASEFMRWDNMPWE
jgi:hypothetical protein